MQTDYPLWGSLERGAYAVGFHQRYLWDYARTYSFQAVHGDAAQGRQHPRPLLVDIWYPAAMSGDERRMTFGDYLAPVASGSDADATLVGFSTALIQFTTETVASYLFGKRFSRLNAQELVAYQAINGLPCQAVRDAVAVIDQFPLLLYHQGIDGTIEDNFVLCEYLASHGYVVVNSTYQPANGESFAIDLDLQRSSKDLACLINFMAGQPNVDSTRIGMIGHSYGAETAFAFCAENNSAMRAFVSLDSTLEYPPVAGSAYERDWVAPLQQQILQRKHNLSLPILVVARHSERGGDPICNDDDEAVTPTFAFCDKLIHADRHYLSFANIGHNDLISQGVIACEQGLPTPDRALVRATYEFICQVTLDFCNEFVKGSPDDAPLAERISRHTGSPPGFGYEHREPNSSFPIFAKDE